MRPDAGRYLTPERKWDGQPRIEAGDPDGGQFTFGMQDGDTQSFSDPQRLYIYTSRDEDAEGEGSGGGGSNGLDSVFTVASGPSDYPFNNHPPLDDPPEIPEVKPPRSSSAALRVAASWLGRALAVGAFKEAALFISVLSARGWARAKAHEIVTSLDPPKSMKELEEAVAVPRRGTELHHHKMEQHVSRQRGIPQSEIDAPGNRVRIPTFKHYDITNWYRTPNERFGGLSPRQYLADKAPDEHARVGREALILFQVLKP
ncbi:hypothetical protein E0H22_10555 [Rhodopseudomonas boonkerdii]|uniref:hypothetical protein n=1 Tax=Rhodopseudomonas boonkerdii TaxID=475937 RepID=UPI001E33EB2D|nr:hypothetical protein [Rhodopseudomonas boonkerdii]UGV26091.1 hypothetical protein E0H22_10555 [Rhodopseudomonas boonkerdii]